jgi:multimeric flavodoxin WrbA
MVRVLGVIGSPRKGGNTELLVNEVLKAAASAGAKTETMFLSDYNLAPCDDCQACFKTKNCVITDDWKELFRRVAEADALVLGSPVYFGGVTAQVKTFIDRIGYLNIARGRKSFMNKIGASAVVGRRTGMLNTSLEILTFLTSARMIVPNGGRLVAVGREKGDVLKDTEGVQNAKELGTRIVELADITSDLGKKAS